MDGAGALNLLPPCFAEWFAQRGWAPRAHQLPMVEKGREGRHALLIAPTGGGKTLAGVLPSLTNLPPANAPRQSAPPQIRPEPRGISAAMVPGRRRLHDRSW
jgi:ATP-dependent Lhr-like helicase